MVLDGRLCGTGGVAVWGAHGDYLSRQGSALSFVEFCVILVLVAAHAGVASGEEAARSGAVAWVGPGCV